MANEVNDVNPKDKMWLVRSSTKVIGPYCLEDIVQLLVVNQISFVDEIRRPTSRWNYIREYPYLTQTVKAKKELLVPDQTKTSPITTSTQLTSTSTDIHSKTPPSIEINFDEIKNIEPLKETPFSFIPKNKTAVVNTPKTFGYLEDQNVKSQLSSKNKKVKARLIILTILIIIALSAVKSYQKMLDGKKVKEKISQISRLYNMKLYEEAHEIYEELKEENEIPTEIAEQLGAARVAYGKESTQVRSQILSNIETISNIKQKGEYLNLVGLTYQIEGDSVKANEFYQNSAIQHPNNEWAIINTGILKFNKTKSLFMNNDFKKDVVSFYKNFSEIRSENFENLNYYHFIKALLNLEFKDILKDEISLNIKELFNVKNKTAFLRNEIQVLTIGLKKAEGTLSDDDYIELIEGLPKQGKMFTRNPLVNWSLTEWEFLDEICDKVIENSTQLMPMLFKAYCSLEVGQYEKSEDLMNKSLLIARGSNHYELMQLHIAFAKSETLKIDFLLKKSDLGNFAVTYYYKGMHCLKIKNLKCAKEAFTALQTKFSDWGYLAQYGLYLADNKTSKQNIYEGIRKEPLYKPLLTERALIEKTE